MRKALFLFIIILSSCTSINNDIKNNSGWIHDDNNVFILGKYGMLNKPCYWKNGQRIEMKGRGISVSDLFVVDTDVYILGEYDYTKACYWKNGQKIDIEDQAIAFDIFVVGTDVYILGGYGMFHKPCYWKNGHRIDIGNHYALALYILDNN
jgi:hypothetical protein